MSVVAQGAPPVYTPGTPPLNPNDPAYLQAELRKLRDAIAALELRGPSAATQAPVKPQAGWIRFALAPWNPLGTGSNVFVWYNGTIWQAV